MKIYSVILAIIFMLFSTFLTMLYAGESTASIKTCTCHFDKNRHHFPMIKNIKPAPGSVVFNFFPHKKKLKVRITDEKGKVINVTTNIHKNSIILNSNLFSKGEYAIEVLGLNHVLQTLTYNQN